MKQLFVSAALLLSVLSAKAQWYPTGPNTYFLYTGNVGIGTKTPSTKLHVDSGAISITGPNAYGGPMLLLGPGAGHNNSWGIETTPSGLNFWRPWSGQANSGNFFLFLKHNNGNVGIKTDNPTAGLTVNSNVLIGNPATVTLPSGYKLYVETGILTEKLKVALKSSAHWADYVFAPGYQLKPLQEVERFVQANKHLPGLPSGEQLVKEGGIDVNQMLAKQMEKIEELTLYMIELSKEMDQLKKENTALRTATPHTKP